MTLPEDRPPPGAPRSRPPRDAATVVVVRDGADGLEVLLLQRAERGDFNSGAWVFPGGLVDPGDGAAQAPGAGLTDEEASRRLSVPSGGLAFYRAAIRECFEEAGLLFANDARGELVSLTDAMAERLSALRGEVQQGTRSFDAACSEFGLRPAPERLHYIAHWLTPVARPKRFDTRFFLAIAPAGQRALHDAQETLDHVWMVPAEALSTRHARRLMNVTRKILELLTPFADTVALAAWAASPRSIERVLPWLALDGGELRPVLPHEPAYAEVRKLDPDGSGDAWCDMRADVAVRLSAHVLRVAAPACSRLAGMPHLIATHSGTFHADDVLGVCVLTTVFPDHQLVRTRNADLARADFTVDVGGVWDAARAASTTTSAASTAPARARRRGQPVRAEGYASAGLVWREFGSAYVGRSRNRWATPRFAEVTKIAADVDSALVRYIDLVDNGEADVAPGVFGLSSQLALLNTTWLEEKSLDAGVEKLQLERFREAMALVDRSLRRFVLRSIGQVLAADTVRRSERLLDGRVLLLADGGMPWTRVVVDEMPDVLLVIYPETGRPQYQIRTVPASHGSFDSRMDLPRDWAGLARRAAGEAVTGVADAVFCHLNLFIGGARRAGGGVEDGGVGARRAA
jgi:uncharacterized UPF0160 family protein/8-oxo-dGTP pyrophosphatase MutT (NUDIX family)